jgi:hypothetical protein
MVRTTFENSPTDNAGGNPAQQPVGTMLARIEQGLMVVSTIMGRMHHAFGQTLAVLHRINRMYMEEEQVLDEAGEVLVKRKDLEGPLDVVPVSDPTVPSEAHRAAQTQVLLQRAQLLPQIYDLRKVEKMFLERMRIASPDEVLLPTPEPQEMNAANENAAAALGRPISAFPTQVHLAHLQTHLDFMNSPMFGMSPIIAPTFIPKMMDHIKEHIVLWYVTEMYNVTTEAAGRDVSEFMKIKDQSVKDELDKLIAQASQGVVDTGAQVFSKIPPVIQQSLKYMQSMMPPLPPDPRIQLDAQKAQMDDARKKEAIQQKQQELQLRVVEGDKDRQTAMQKEAMALQREQMRIQAAGATADKKIQSDQQKVQVTEQSESERKAAEIESREKINTQDNLTALSIAEAEIESGERVAVEKGTSINPG